MTMTEAPPAAATARPSMAEWKQIVARYEVPSVARATWQIVNTVVPYAFLWWVMYQAYTVSWWLSLPVAAVAGALTVRIFIIFHDCGHGSFFKSPTANAVTGFLCGMLTFAPYYHWRWQHSLHHGTTGNLDRRGTGDIWTMTVQEYLESSRWKRFAYRLARNPVVLFVIAPVFLVLVRQRFPSSDCSPRERRSVWWMNLALAGMVAAMCWVFGVVPYLVLQVTVVALAGAAGVWLFYVQHQFEDAYWERREDWDYTAAAMQGSSFYQLPAILRWFSGNIGYHHVHHLSSRIPNYHLKRCHDSHPMFKEVKPLTLWASLRTMKLQLWDEQMRKLVGYIHAHRRRQEQKGAPPPGASTGKGDQPGST
jgi:omega-6 fatty acid desaturase (delta-12 desaturase)